MPIGFPVAPPKAKAPNYGLLVSADPPESNSTRWMEGISYAPEGCAEGTTYDRCDVTGYDAPSKPGIVSWQPYVLSWAEECSTFGNDLEEAAARARRGLLQDTERQIGRELWTGELAQASTLPSTDPWPNTWLADVGNVDILSESGAVGFVHALACLEQYLADLNGGRQGMIHATPQLITHWESFRLLRKVGTKILTMQDNVVVPSPGYPGTSPDGAVGDNNVWAYATDMVEVFLGDIQPPRAMDSVTRSSNTVTMRAERMALAHWERCRHAGVRVAMQVCDRGGS